LSASDSDELPPMANIPLPQALQPQVQSADVDAAPAERPAEPRRRFAPVRPGTKRRAQPTHWVPALPAVSKAEAQQAQQAQACPHVTCRKAGCAMVCDSCGEEVLYDGWKMEQLEEMETTKNPGPSFVV
ncbi:unnamed protein product, partial [Effrenium voratum]